MPERHFSVIFVVGTPPKKMRLPKSSWDSSLGINFFDLQIPCHSSSRPRPHQLDSAGREPTAEPTLPTSNLDGSTVPNPLLGPLVSSRRQPCSVTLQAGPSDQLLFDPWRRADISSWEADVPSTNTWLLKSTRSSRTQLC